MVKYRKNAALIGPPRLSLIKKKILGKRTVRVL